MSGSKNFQVKKVKMSEVTIKRTDTVIMEYVLLPVISISYRFLYRFLEPITTVWTEGDIPGMQIWMRKVRKGIPGLDDQELVEYNEHQSLKNLMPRWAIDTLRDSVYSSVGGKENVTDDIRWLTEMKIAAAIECKIERKE